MTGTRQRDRTLIVAGGWHDETPGGAYKLATDFARYLAARDYIVDFICPSPAAAACTRDVVDGVTVRRYPAPAAPSPSLRNVRDHLQQTRDATRATLADGPVAALLGHSQLQYLAAAAECGGRVRACYGVHSPFALELREGATSAPTVRQRLSWSAAGWMERRIIRASQLVHCDSAFTRSMLISQYGDAFARKSAVLPGWVDCSAFALDDRPRRAIRAALGQPWTPDVPTFLALRRLVPRMGLDALIDGAARLAARGRTFRVVIGGEGPARGDLEARARARGLADRVAFIGRVPQAQLASVYAAADCFVLPTRALECFGLIILEAYACGVPVIGVPVGAIPEVMGPGFSAWLAADNQPESIAQRMEQVLDGTLRADPGRLRARAREFDAETVMAQHAQALLGAPAAVCHGVA